MDDGLLSSLAGGGLHFRLQLVAKVVEIEAVEPLEHRLRSHTCLKNSDVAVAKVSISTLSEQIASPDAFDLVHLIGKFTLEFGLVLVNLESQLVDLCFERKPGSIRWLVIVIFFGRFRALSEGIELSL